jgi:hypothetical protein
MKTFEWRMVKRIGESSSRPCLIEVLELGEVNRFWAALTEMGELYHPIVLDKDRKRFWHITENLTFKDAKEAVEKELFDLGVIEDGDTLIDHTE